MTEARLGLQLLQVFTLERQSESRLVVMHRMSGYFRDGQVLLFIENTVVDTAANIFEVRRSCLTLTTSLLVSVLVFVVRL